MKLSIPSLFLACAVFTLGKGTVNAGSMRGAEKKGKESHVHILKSK